MAQGAECLDVFILSGQSNMSGRGGIVHLKNGTTVWNQVVPEEANAPDGSSVLRLSAGLHWEIAKEPLHYDIDLAKVCGVGPGLVFAASVLKLLKDRGEAVKPVGLVPCAIGATSIVEWAKEGELYAQMINRAEAARRSGGTLKGLLWYQGESDAVSKEYADLYQRRLEKLFTDVRSDLNDQNLPVLQVKITGTYDFIQEVRAAQSAVQVPRVYTADAWGLALNPDNIHLTTESQVKIGKDLAKIYVCEVLSQCPA